MKRHLTFLSITALTFSLHAAPHIRCHSFLVNPSTGPVAEIDITTDAPWAGTLTVTPPDGWTIDPQTHDITLTANETKTIPYRITKAREVADNAYPFILTLTGGPTTTQTVRTASAPFHKPKIDAKLNEWNDAIPIRFGTPATTLRTYWDNTAFYLAIEVEEKNLTPNSDAIQLHLAPKNATDKRHEFLIQPTSKTKATVKRLLDATDTDTPATVALRHANGTTTYEIAIPHTMLNGIRIDAGREFRLGLLIHDPDGTGLRDLSAIMNYPPATLTTTPTSWTLWQGGCWGTPLHDGGTEFGFCSSIH